MPERATAPDSCLIVGAGISGLLAARELASAGIRVVVLDKGRGVGGRMATRRIDSSIGTATCDHGAQFVTARSDIFKTLMHGWLDAGVAEEWSRGFAGPDGKPKEDGHPRYRGAGGMTSIPRHLVRGLDDVRTGEKVVEISAREGAWEVRAESGMVENAGALILTAPVPQSLALLDKNGISLPAAVDEALRQIAYDPCLALMAVLDGPSRVPEPGGVQVKGEVLDWVADNRRKGISEATAITLHAGPRWSRSHYDDAEATVKASLLSAASGLLGEDLASRAVATSLARWRYSWVAQGHAEPCLVASEDPPLVFAGDAFGGAKVEGAALSGLAAAGRLLDMG